MFGGTSGQTGIVVGTVQAVDSSSVTVALTGGRTVQIALTGNTTHRLAGSSTAAGSADLKVGSTVTIWLVAGRNLTAGQVVIRNPWPGVAPASGPFTIGRSRDRRFGTGLISARYSDRFQVRPPYFCPFRRPAICAPSRGSAQPT